MRDAAARTPGAGPRATTLNRMLVGAIAASALVCGCRASAQSPPDMKTYASSAEVAALIAKAKADLKPGQPLLLQPLLRLAPYKANLEYRILAVPPAVHETDAEFFYIIDGAGTLITGGSLVAPKRASPGNLSGTSIEGGTTRTVQKGDFVIIPENMPHWFSAIDGHLVMMSLHVPRQSASAAP